MKKLLKNMKENEKGFTLIELIVVIAIIGILAAVLLPKFGGFTDSARKKAVVSEAKNIYTAYAAVQAEQGMPTDSAAASTAIQKFLGKLPKGADTPISGSTPAVVGPPVTLKIQTTDLTKAIIEYSPVVNGKKYDVKIGDGGAISLKGPDAKDADPYVVQ